MRALELEPDNSVALIGLGRDRIAAGEPDNALAYFEKAILVDSADPAPLREAIEMLRTEGRTGEAEVKLEELLELEPYDAGAALLLARLRVDRNAEKPHSIALGRLAARFGKGRQRAAAIELLKELGAPPI
ncbi:MAG: tetratricopeptide repeat protein [Deltaproteobacteria bacterium]|nr:tetratricopeptide repeat protein [Deltaproteobacteria bacterium]